MTASEVKRLSEKVKAASRELAIIDTKTKDRALIAMA